MANVMPAWFGATSAWLLKCPDELAAQSPMASDITLQEKKENVNTNEAINLTWMNNKKNNNKFIKSKIKQ